MLRPTDLKKDKCGEFHEKGPHRSEENFPQLFADA